jgi:hypothetical protein
MGDESDQLVYAEEIKNTGQSLHVKVDAISVIANRMR